MKLSKLLCYLTLFITVYGVCVVVSSECGPGYYKEISFIPCHECEPGTYCPGDDLAHDCPDGTFSTWMATSCSSCPSKRSNRGHTACLLEDTPKDAFEIIDGKVFEVHAAKITNVYLTIAPFTSNGGSTQVSFIGRDKNSYGGLTVYSSLKTGYPTPANSISKGEGLDATVSFSRNEHNVTIVYFSLLSPNSRIPFSYIPKSFIYFTKEITMPGNTFNINKYYSDQQANLLQFKKDFLPKNTAVNIKFQIYGIGYPNPFQLLYSTIPTITQLTPYNADVKVDADKNMVAQLSVKQSRDGPFIFGFYADQTSLYFVNFNVTLSY